MNTENIIRVRRLDLNTVLYSGLAYQSQGSSAAGHWINTDINFRVTDSVATGKIGWQQDKHNCWRSLHEKKGLLMFIRNIQPES